jgi:hypothetical protein
MTIYVELLEEGVPCWRPVKAEKLPDGSFRILDSCPEEECWAFETGDVVKCEKREVQGGVAWVAYSRAG